jgi:hypothetical protein
MRLWWIVALLGVAPLAGCDSSESSSDREARVSRVIEACSGHGGVAAFDDDAVICADQTSNGVRASRAVEACRDHGGVSAFDDDIVICDDETTHQVEGG